MKKLVKILCIFLVLFCIGKPGYAQQDAQFSHYMFNSMYYNPGYAGIEGVTRFTGLFRKQWLGYSNNSDAVGGTSPTSALMTVSSLLPFFKKSTGGGLNFLYDTKGPITTIQLELSAAYHLKIKTGKLGIGVRSGIYNQSLRSDWYRVVDPTDPIYTSLQNSPANQMKADVTGGLFWQTPKYYVGLSVSHLTRSKFTYGIDSISSKLSDHIYATAGYTFKLNGGIIKITPNAFFQTDTKHYTYLFGGIVTYNDKFYGGISARESIAAKDISVGGNSVANDDIIFLIGMNLMKNNAMRIGYAFDYVTSGVQAKTRTSHEIMLSYVVPVPWDKPKPIIRTPRYRQEEY